METLTTEEHALAEAAKTAAIRAGEIILRGLDEADSEFVEIKTSKRDIVTKSDKECQDVIKATISAAFPEHKFLGEEDVEPGIEASTAATLKNCNEPHLWIVDPIDGTTNFSHGTPLSVVIIAYASYGVVKFGHIYDPYRNEHFYGWKGKGSYVNGKRMKCSTVTELGSSLMSTGSPPGFKALEAAQRATKLLWPEVQSLRMLGSAGVHLAWVAAGRLTAYFEADLNSWDNAAGSLLIEEAGGKFTDVWGKVYTLNTRNTVASNGFIHSILLEKLQESHMWI